jgi:uncharacterized membrane protein YbhN (UPF0104 family)
MGFKRIITSVVKFGAAVTVVVLCGLAVAGNLDRIRDYRIEPSWLFVGAGFLFVAAVVVGGFNWHRLLAQVSGQGLPVSATIIGHTESWLYRYIPGVGYLGHKITWAHGKGITRAAATSAFVYEQILIQATSFSFGVFAMGLALLSTGGTTELWGIAAGVALAAVVIFIFSGKTIATIVESIRRRRNSIGEMSIRFLSPRSVATLFGGFILPRLLNAGAVIALTVAVVPLPIEQLVALGGAYAIASALGILAVFVPSGLGVREGVFVVLALAIGVTVVDAIMLSAIARLISTLADVGIGLFVIASRTTTQGEHS